MVAGDDLVNSAQKIYPVHCPWAQVPCTRDIKEVETHKRLGKDLNL